MRLPGGVFHSVIAVFLASLIGGVLAAGGKARDAAFQASTYRDEVLADNPVSYWRFNESGGTTAADAKGLNAGTYQNGVLLGQPGAIKSDPASTAASFDGANDGVSVPDSASLDLTAGVSLELWVKRSGSGVQALAGKPADTRSKDENYSLWLDTANRVRMDIGNGTTFASATSAAALDTSWHHVVGTFDSTMIKVYVDGVLSGSSTADVALTPNSEPFLVARTTNKPAYYAGSLDELAVYNTALSATRVAAHYQAGITTDLVPPTVTLAQPQNGSYRTSSTVTFSGTAGSATGDSSTVTVKIYAGASPSGTPALTLSAARQADSSWTTSTALADGQWTAQAEQSDASGNIGSSSPSTFVVDTRAPVTTISSTPPNPSGSSDASFGFFASEPAGFECRLDAAVYAACTSPKTYAGLAGGSHTFNVRATDQAGNTGAAAGYTWTVSDTTPPPVPSIDSAPSNPSGDEVTFTFSDAEAGAVFQCRLDAAAFAGCTSPRSYVGLVNGVHTFEVRALDQAGNASAAAARTWTVDEPPPPSIGSHPVSPTTSAGATFTFSGPAGVTFECRLDFSAYAACTSPQSYAGLADGGHTFQVRARNSVDRSDPTEFGWTIDTSAPPAPSIDSGPAGTTNSTSASFSFSEAGTPSAASLGGSLPPPLPASTGTTYYVATSGSDTNPGTLSQPWRTIQKALDTVGPGAKVLVRGGVYNENLTMQRAGTATDPITLANYPGEQPALDPALSSPSYPLRITSGAAYFRVQGLVIENAPSAVGGRSNVFVTGSSPTGAHHVEISGCEIRFAREGSGVFINETADHVQILGNRIHDNNEPGGERQRHGIYDEGSDAVIAGNLIYNHTNGWGIQIWPGAVPGPSNQIVANNTTVDNSAGGIVVNHLASNTTIVNNITAFNGNYGIRGYWDGGVYPNQPVGAGNAAYNNIAFGNANNLVNDPVTAGPTPGATIVDYAGGNTTADPAFVDRMAHDYHLAGPGPALDSARPEFALSPDLEGTIRPRGPAPDLGALEGRVVFQCRLDSGSFAPCTSPKSYSNLAGGNHSFEVKARDAAGNESGTTRSTWTVNVGGPKVRSVSSSAGNALPAIAIDKPIGAAQGDVLVAIVSHQSGSNRSMTAPAGWTAIPGTDVFEGTNAHIHAWYRLAGASEPVSYTFTLTGGDGRDSAGGIIAISGASQLTPVDASGGQSNGSTASTSVAAPSITTTVSSTLLIYAGSGQTAATYTPPTGMTEQFDRATSGTYKVSIESATQALTGSGATGTRTALASTSVRSVGIAIAVR